MQAAVTTQSGGNWLQFLNGHGIVTFPSPYLIEVSALPGQAPGVYQGSVVLSGTSVPSDNKTINVTLNVTTAPTQTDNFAPIRLTSYPGGAPQYMYVTLNNLGQGGLTIASAASTSKFLTATVSGNTLLIAADPTGLTAGVYNGTITLNSNAANNAQVSIPVELLVAPAGQPVISTGGIVNIANGAQEAVLQGDIVAIYGNQLAPTGTSATNASTPLATTLGQTQVLSTMFPHPFITFRRARLIFKFLIPCRPGRRPQSRWSRTERWVTCGRCRLSPPRPGCFTSSRLFRALMELS